MRGTSVSSLDTASACISGEVSSVTSSTADLETEGSQAIRIMRSTRSKQPRKNQCCRLNLRPENTAEKKYERAL